MSVNPFETIAHWLRSPLCDALEAARSPLQGALALIVDLSAYGGDSRKDMETISSHRTSGRLERVFLRIEAPGAVGQNALIAFAALRPDGFVLTGCAGRADIQQLDVMLRVAEAECGFDDGSQCIFAEVGRAPGFFLSGHDLRHASERLKGLVFNQTDFYKATNPQRGTGDMSGSASRSFARAVSVLSAAQAQVPCLDLLPRNLPASANLDALGAQSRADGFSGLICRSLDQATALSLPDSPL